MEGIFKYLARHKNLTPPHASKKKIFIETVRTECGIVVEESQIDITRGGIILSCHPTVRSELVRAAPQLLGELQKKHNIRFSFIR